MRDPFSNMRTYTILPGAKNAIKRNEDQRRRLDNSFECYPFCVQSSQDKIGVLRQIIKIVEHRCRHFNPLDHACLPFLQIINGRSLLRQFKFNDSLFDIAQALVAPADAVPIKVVPSAGNPHKTG